MRIKDKSDLLDVFARGFNKVYRAALRGYLSLPNTPDSIGLIRLYNTYGLETIGCVSDNVEDLRIRTGLDYDTLRKELLKRTRTPRQTDNTLTRRYLNCNSVHLIPNF